MPKISEIISLYVLSIYESEHIGCVYNIEFNDKTNKFDSIYILDKDENNMFKVATKNILATGKDAIIIKNSSILELSIADCTQRNNLIGRLVFGLDGKKIGKVYDCIIDKNYKLTCLEIENGILIPMEKVIHIGDIIFVGEQKLNINKYKPSRITISRKIQTDEKEVFILKDDSPSYPLPQKLITDYRFIIGRKVTDNVNALNGELIARCGQTITKETISKASTYGKLIELARNSTKKSNSI